MPATTSWYDSSATVTPVGVLTIGHSNHALDVFLRLLQEQGVETVVDVRSQPHSSFAPQYNAEALRKSLEEHGFEYVYLGRELGGRPDGAQFYDQDGRVFYGRVAASQPFLEGVERLRQGAQTRRVALMCAEENPSVCHRRLLIARVLHEQGWSVAHIRASGAVETEAELVAAEAAAQPQLALFEYSKIREWKSIPSVLPKKQPSASSAS
jgi:uncharacterized protein (DUF488 family)